METNEETTVRHRRSSPKPKGIELLVTIVNPNKAEFFMDYLSQFEVNMQLNFHGTGTAKSEMLRYLGLENSEKQVIFSWIRQDRVLDAMNGLKEKFEKVRGGKGIAFTVPLSGLCGVSLYQFFGNFRKNKDNRGEE